MLEVRHVWVSAQQQIKHLQSGLSLALLKVSKWILHYLSHEILPPYFTNFIIENMNCFISPPPQRFLFPTAVLQTVMRRQHAWILKIKLWSTAWRPSWGLQTIISRMGPRNLYRPQVSAVKATHSSPFTSLLPFPLFTNTFSWSLGTVPHHTLRETSKLQTGFSSSHPKNNAQ